jgi:hypothetical protein
MSLKSLKKAFLDYQPRITTQGKAALYVLSNSDGALSVQQLTSQVMDEYSELFADFQQALNFVQSLINKYA